jgi:cobalt/nickel transport system permease protein
VTLEAALASLGSLDALARRDTPMARLDARAKVIATAAYVAVVASLGPRDLGRLAPLALFPAAVAALGDVPLGPLAVRLALASPFALAVAGAEPLLARGAGEAPLGWIAFASVLARFVLAVGAGLLLVATTGFDAVVTALRRLGAPRVLAVQLLLTWRYAFVLADEAARMARGRALRAHGQPVGPRAAAQLLGALLARALDRAQRIHAAMVCRGFSGSFPARAGDRFGAADAAFVVGSLLWFAAVRRWDLAALAGRAVSGGAP